MTAENPLSLSAQRAESALDRYEARKRLEQVVFKLRREGRNDADISTILGIPESTVKALGPNRGGGIPFSSPDELNPDQYMDKAKQMVIDHVEASFPDVDDYTVYIIWFCKTLQNWKAILSTSIPDGRIYEITYNGDKLEAYLDSYVKELNVVVSDLPNPIITNIQGDS